MNEGPNPAELVVERVPVAGRRPIQSAMIVGAVLVSFIGVAIFKPWVPSPSPDSSAAEPSPLALIAAPSPDPTNASPPTAPEMTPLPFIPHPAELLGIASAHDAWGFRAVVVPSVTKRFDVDGPVLTERWMSIDVAHGEMGNPANGDTAENEGDAVLAIGPTLPAGVKALGFRFWRFDDTPDPREIMPVPVALPAGHPDRGIRLWLPDSANSTAIGTWSPGRRDLREVADGIVHLVMVVRVPSPTG